MKRREFITKTVFASAATLAMPGMLLANRIANDPVRFPDLVEVIGNSPPPMATAGISALGGINRFMRPGQKVLIKPTIAFDAPPESGLNTNPWLVMRMVLECQKAGAKQVYVFDSSIDDWRKSYKTSGIERAVKLAMSKIVPANIEEQYIDVRKLGLSNLEELKIHRQVAECEVIINIPSFAVLPEGRVMDGYQNLAGLFWNRASGYRKTTDEVILDFLQQRKIHLTVIDALRMANLKEHSIAEHNSLVLSHHGIVADRYAYSHYLPEFPIPAYLEKASHNLNHALKEDKLSVEKIYL